MAELTENSTVQVRLVLAVGALFVAGLIAFMDVKGDVKSLVQRADVNDVRDAASVTERTAHGQQLTELRVMLGAFSKSMDEMKGDLKDVKKATVPEEPVVRAGGRSR